ncbi:hypothetical protein [Blastococcus sp. SYSU DS0619]
MADYSEFPTTPTAWQEQQLRDWQTVTPLSTEDTPEPPRRSVDRPALAFGIVFIVLAVVLMAGVSIPMGIVEDGGFVWFMLIAGGVSLLISELKKTRHRGR